MDRRDLVIEDGADLIELESPRTKSIILDVRDLVSSDQHPRHGVAELNLLTDLHIIAKEVLARKSGDHSLDIELWDRVSAASTNAVSTPETTGSCPKRILTLKDRAHERRESIDIIVDEKSDVKIRSFRELDHCVGFVATRAECVPRWTCLFSIDELPLEFLEVVGIWIEVN